MIIEYESELNVNFHAHPHGIDQWSLADPFSFTVDNREFVIEKGFMTDFASVPRPVWSIISPYDLGVGCIPHDFGYRKKIVDKPFWDQVFLACMEKDNITKWKRLVAYRAVDLFGSHAWNTPYKQEKEIHLTSDPKDIKAIFWRRELRELTNKDRIK